MTFEQQNVLIFKPNSTSARIQLRGQSVLWKHMQYCRVHHKQKDAVSEMIGHTAVHGFLILAWMHKVCSEHIKTSSTEPPRDENLLQKETEQSLANATGT